MLIPEDKIRQIKRVIAKKYAGYLVSLFGRTDLPEELVQQLRSSGVNLTNIKGFLTTAYRHNLTNNFDSPTSPKTLAGMASQQRQHRASGKLQESAVQHLNANLLALVERPQKELESRIERLVRESNQNFTLEQLGKPVSEAIRGKSVGKLKTELQDASHDANRNWDRVAVTEISNAVSLGSADRIITENEGKNPEDIYVYRIVRGGGAHTCKWCRSFYLDTDGTPKVYRLSTLLSNGSNYGKPTSQWAPCVSATHPREKCSPIIELKPGWKLLMGGIPSYIGLEAWQTYIKAKIGPV